jgi:hypothetical protein
MERPRPPVEEAAWAPGPAPLPLRRTEHRRCTTSRPRWRRAGERAHWRRLATQRSAALRPLEPTHLRAGRPQARPPPRAARRARQPGVARLRCGIDRAGLVVASLPGRGRAPDAPPSSRAEVVGPRAGGRPTIGVAGRGRPPRGRRAREGRELARRPHDVDRDGTGGQVGAAVDRAVRAAGGDLVCLVLRPASREARRGSSRCAGPCGTTWSPRHRRCSTPRRRLRSSTPHDARLRSEGLRLVLARTVCRSCDPLRAGEDADPSRPGVDVGAGSPACLVVDRRAFERPVASSARRPGRSGRRPVRPPAPRRRRVVSVPSVIVVDHRPVASLARLRAPSPTTARVASVLRRARSRVRRSVEGADARRSLRADTAHAPR